MLSIFCHHDYRPRKVVRGENLLGDVQYAISIRCIRCYKVKLDKGYSSQSSAEDAMQWFKEQQL